ncbi:baculoviral IAP repeat-containing protein 1 isoform X3 [Bufo gargarizans]|uniref:baculoviral IAP repeat-containing protein 1 isoform X3 n=1 Tax=Bufo gargarizans TaxID=30331 RepID=UPI001CF26BE7|nr:baculoviral IAP repeat-containing protein 1 isoform X3 [Bufo gargarizans]
MLDVNTEKFYANQSAQHTAIRERLGTAYDVNMRWEAKRLKSFLTCKRISFWAPMEMASAGMYYTGVEDSMQCFCCGIVLFCTRLTLTPREQHLQLNPSCGFIQGKDVGNIAKYEVRVQTSETGQESAEAYSTEEARLSSYTNWPFYAKIQPVHLASAGFYFTGRRDIVQCFSCAGCLGHWEENDDPWKEHSKWFPECNFLISKKPPDEIKVLINSYNGFPGFTGKHFLTGVIGSTEPCQPSYTKMSLFQDENVRLESFKKWPSDAKKDTASIARAGFYYTGRGDIVLCISCAGCVYNWEENDEPCKEHAKFIPDCPFLLKTETTPEDLKNPDEEKKDVHMKVSEFVLLNIQAFKALKELVVCCPMDDNKWEVIDLLSDEFKSMHNIEKIVFENINMERHAGRLASFIEHFHNLISFKMECKYCPGIGNIINSLCRNGKLQELRFPELLFHNQEIIHLGSALPSLRNLKILEIEFDYSAKAEPVIAFVEGLACLEHLEEFTFPGGDGVRETMTSFIQTLQHMPKLANLTIQRRLLNDSSLLELAKIIAAGHLRNLQKLDLDNNLHITQSGWRDFFLLLDNLPKLTVLHISRTISHQYVTDPVTFITLTQSVSRLHSLETLSMLGWLLDDKDIEMFDSMKMKHPQSKVLTLFWKWTLPFSPVLTK